MINSITGIKLYEHIKNNPKDVKKTETLDMKAYLNTTDNRNEYCGYKIDFYF